MLSASAIRSAPEARAAVRWGRRAGQSRATGNAGSPAVGERAVRGARRCGSPGPAVGRASVRGGSKAVFISFFKFNLTFKCNTRAREF